MRIECNRIGGFCVQGVVLTHGTNEVDDAKWAAAVEQCIPAWIDAIQAGPNPEIVVCGDSTSKPAPPAAPLSARDKKAMAAQCETLAQLDALRQGETRKTVINAINRRAVELEVIE